MLNVDLLPLSNPSTMKVLGIRRSPVLLSDPRRGSGNSAQRGQQEAADQAELLKEGVEIGEALGAGLVPERMADESRGQAASRCYFQTTDSRVIDIM